MPARLIPHILSALPVDLVEVILAMGSFVMIALAALRGVLFR